MVFSYCTNIHPGETWAESMAALQRHIPALRRELRLAGSDPFPLGLRLSATAAAELAGDKALIRRLRQWMEEENLLAYTINGFPYGAFHGTRVKEQVFAPDWSDPARADYTMRLFRILAELLPEGAEGSVSTVPGSFKSFVAAEPARLSAMLTALRGMADTLEDLSRVHGLDLHLGLEPEPLGLLECRADTLGFFERLHDGVGADASARIARRIGVCYDACHFAIAYDEPADVLGALKSEGIRLSKIHLSNALALDPRNADALEAVAAFDEPTYLHQVAALRADGTILRHTDLGDALSQPVGDAVEWRVHFHIPLFAEPIDPLRSTASHLDGLASWLHAHPDACRHFEMETYTFDVLPPALRPPSVIAMLAAEYRWCLGRFFLPHDA